MWYIKKALLRKAAVAVLIVVTLGALVVGVALAGSGVTILTAPLSTEPVYVDQNGNGVYEDSELLGTFAIYEGGLPITFSWTPYNFPSGVNGSYRIALWQDVTPFAANPTWVETKVAHHWASNPNGTTFTMGAFGAGEDLCTTCPSMIVVQAETFVKYYNEETDTYEYRYTLVPASLTAASTAGGARRQTSTEFIIQLLPPSPAGSPMSCDPSQPNVESGQWVDVDGEYCACIYDGSLHPAHNDPYICWEQERDFYYLEINGPCGCVPVENGMGE